MFISFVPFVCFVIVASDRPTGEVEYNVIWRDDILAASSKIFQRPLSRATMKYVNKKQRPLAVNFETAT